MMAPLISLTFALHVALAGPDWSPDVFDYNRPARLDVRDSKDPGRVKVARATHQHLVFRNLDGQDVPALITLPRKGRPPFPVVMLVHAYASTREQVTHYIAPAMLERGFATIAIDLPMHGDRPGPPTSLFSEEDPKKSHDQLVRAVTDLRQAIDLAESRRELDTSRGIYMVGYSMGGWLAALAAGADRRVSALVLMVPVSEAGPRGLPVRPKDGKVERPLLDEFPNLRPTGAVAHFAPRPVLIQAGRLDLHLPKAPVDALYAAAREPKELRWYDSGHVLPDKAIEEAANWLLQRAAGHETNAGGAGKGVSGGEGARKGAEMERMREGERSR